MLAGYKLVLDIHMLIVILATKRGGGGGGGIVDLWSIMLPEWSRRPSPHTACSFLISQPETFIMYFPNFSTRNIYYVFTLILALRDK
jgi:hypothetical protein